MFRCVPSEVHRCNPMHAGIPPMKMENGNLYIYIYSCAKWLRTRLFNFRFKLQTNQIQGVQIHIEEPKQCIPLAQYSRPINQTQLQVQLIFQLFCIWKTSNQEMFSSLQPRFFCTQLTCTTFNPCIRMSWKKQKTQNVPIGIDCDLLNTSHSMSTSHSISQAVRKYGISTLVSATVSDKVLQNTTPHYKVFVRTREYYSALQNYYPSLFHTTMCEKCLSFLQSLTKNYSVLQSTTPYCYKVLLSATKYYSVLHSSNPYYKLLLRTMKYYSVLHSTQYYKVLQSIAPHYNVLHTAPS